MSLFVFLFLVLLVSFVNAQNSYCCEKTINGAWCQNAPVEQCVDNFRKAATSCEATTYCKLGTCVDVGEGFCQENTPQKVCENNQGIWYDKPKDELPQCQLGCCLLGDQGAFVTQTRCKTLSSLYGLETIFRNDINNQIMCIASATSDAKGACVIEKNGERTCQMVTQEDCRTMDNLNPDSDQNLFEDLSNDESTIDSVDISFHEGYLCSADVLATNCGPSGPREGTTCVENADQVYFVDTCGNLANVYDYSKRNDQNYWTYIVNIEDSCGYEQSNANSRECGNCDYYAGSTCKSYRDTDSPAARYGDYVCSDLSCEYEGKDYQHGEVWCASNTEKNVELNLPGSEDFRLLCYDGEVTVEPCDPWRSTICVESEVEGFSYAACKSNRWQDCIDQTTEKDCANIDKRDCEWIEGYSILKDEEGLEIKLENLAGKELKSSCVPEFSPGFDFWNAESESESICSIGTYYCLVKYEYGIFTGKESIEEKDELKRKKCEENCKCIPGYEKGDSSKCESGCESNSDFLSSFQEICGSTGDCGVSYNYVGSEGYYDEYEIDFGDII